MTLSTLQALKIQLDTAIRYANLQVDDAWNSYNRAIELRRQLLQAQAVIEEKPDAEVRAIS